ncbi:DUF2520 domain-containing protein [Clostridium sp. CTA-5]
MLYHYGGDTIRVGFIGPGKVSVSLARYFTHKGIKLTGFYGKNVLNTQEAANITKSKLYYNLEDLVKESDILFITTPDDIISTIDKQLSKFDLNNKSFCHTSGSLSSNILINAKCSGALTYSIHPIFAFSSKNTDLKELGNIFFSVEGEITNKDSEIIKLLTKLGNKYFIRSSDTSSIYHLANVLVSNLVLSLLEIGTEYFINLGLNEKEALEAIYPLVKGNIQSIFDKGFVKSLTGPVVRGDVMTVKNHILMIKEEHKDIYKVLSLNLLKLTSLKECRDYSTTNNSVDFYEESTLNNLFSHSKKHKDIYEVLGGIE